MDGAGCFGSDVGSQGAVSSDCKTRAGFRVGAPKSQWRRTTRTTVGIARTLKPLVPTHRVTGTGRRTGDSYRRRDLVLSPVAAAGESGQLCKARSGFRRTGHVIQIFRVLTASTHLATQTSGHTHRAHVFLLVRDIQGTGHTGNGLFILACLSGQYCVRKRNEFGTA